MRLKSVFLFFLGISFGRTCNEGDGRQKLVLPEDAKAILPAIKVSPDGIRGDIPGISWVD